MRPRTMCATLPARRGGLRAFAAVLLLLAVAALLSQAPEVVRKADAQAASTSLVVRDLRSGDPIPQFRFVVNQDNVGDPDDPANAPSVIKAQSHSPVVAAGDETNADNVALDPGKYLVSVLADGHKIGGEHFTVPSGGPVEVLLQPEPRAGLDPSRLSKIQVHAFQDDRMVNGENDAPLEAGLEGFDVVIKDEVGEVTQDYFGNPLGTEYEKDANGDLVLDADGQPIPVPETGGQIVTDASGDATVENLAPGKYGVWVVPPDGEGWIQTSTLEGTHTIDAWIDEGSDGTITEAIGQPSAPMAVMGFVKEKAFATPGTGSVRGRILTTKEFATQSPNPPLGEPVVRPYIALTALDQNDELSYLGRGNPDGTFEVNGVPNGTYQMVIFDGPLDYIISFRTVIVRRGEAVDMGDVGVPRWFAQIDGHVFADDGMATDGTDLGPGASGNQIRDCAPNDPNNCEKGIPNVEVLSRFKDGTVKYGAATGRDGHYSMEEVFPFGRFMVTEVGAARMSSTGASVRSEYDATTVKGTSVPGALTMGTFSWSGVKNYIDWGKRGYAGSENGGISGIVYYATMRTEQNARYQAADDYEPGIPNVTVNLYEALTDPQTGEPLKNTDGSVQRGPLVDSVQTDAWEQPEGCDVLDENGDPAPNLIGDRANLGPKCLEVFALGAEAKDGVFDGGYAFGDLQPGEYVVETVPPEGYKIVKEEDVNTDMGENFVPQVPPAPCAGALHAVNDPRSPYDGQEMPLCDSKLVELNARQNAAADFHLFTDVPVPGRVVGLVTDDLNVETNPERLYYGDKRGIPNIPIGVRDHTGRLIQTVYTDQNGIFETILPSTATYNLPTPSGVSPNMYTFLTNDPGDIDNRNPVKGPGVTKGYDPNYGSLKLIYDVWPGKTTYADLAILPNTPGGGVPVDDPPCRPAAGTPVVDGVEDPVINQANRGLVVFGKNFGPDAQILLGNQAITAGSVSPDGTRINVTVPRGSATGARQLLVRSGGRTSETGVTVHVLGTTYNPQVVRVGQGQKIQAAIDAAQGDTLIVVGPGTYTENLIFHKDVKLQGVGSGRVTLDGSFPAANSADWQRLFGRIAFDGNRDVPEGAAITVLARAGEFTTAFRPSIDGLTIKGGRDGLGGGVFVNGYGANLGISNNAIESNRGFYGGAVALGRPYDGNARNPGVRILYNRISGNGGRRFAGAIGIYSGASGYRVSRNVIVNNFSAEYGGGVSHFGYSPEGTIVHNNVCYNGAFDEGGGIMVAGELALNPNRISQGSGRVTVDSNRVQDNLSNDDGGGIRVLEANLHRVVIQNNMVANNVATDQGGGLALDDAPYTTLVNNTVTRNATTATAEDATGVPQAAGLTSALHSDALRARLPASAPDFSDPVMFANTFRDNRAGRWDGARVVGIGLPGDATPTNLMDLAVTAPGGNRLLKPAYSILSVPYGAQNPTNKVGVDPLFRRPSETLLTAIAFAGDPTFIIVTLQPPAQPGDYHIRGQSPARNAAVMRYSGTDAPETDIDDDRRPTGPQPDIGADEFVGGV